MTVVLSAAALLAPGWLGWQWTAQHVLAEERAELNRTNALVASQSNAILDQMTATLRHFQQMSLASCSDAHIARMRASTISIRTVDEIGYYRDGHLACNTWGRLGPSAAPMPVFTRADPQWQLHTSSFSVASPDTRMVGLYSRGHYVYVEPGRFADVPLARDVQVAVFSVAGEPITGRNQPDWLSARRVIDGGPPHDQSRLFARLIDDEFSVVASLPMSRVETELRRQRWQLLPLALLTWAAGMLMIVWWLRRRLSLAGELSVAIARGELEVHYQPIIRLGDGKCVGAEALVRWRHPSGRWIAPDEFVALAEQRGMVSRITRLVMHAVVEEMGPALRADRGLHIAVNLSPQDMHDGATLKVLSTLPAAHGINADQIWLEATERGFMDLNIASEVIGAWRRRGHVIAIDDFGTGYSSLSHLQALPLDVLKIDKSFVDKIGTDSASSPVISHVIEMARSLGLAIVAEGIETEEQAVWLHRQRVEFGQGWWFARPMPAAGFLALLRERGKVGPAGVGDDVEVAEVTEVTDSGACPSAVADPGEDQRDGRQ